MKITKWLLALSLAIFSTTVFGAELLDATLRTGVDTNPFLFGDDFSPDAALFMTADVGLKHRVGSGFGVSGRWQETRYENDASDADERVLSAEVDFRKADRLFGMAARYSADVSIHDRDQTYVSRLHGAVGTIGGVPVPDRYDARWVDANAGVELTPIKRLSVGLSVDGRTREYEDYTDIGASNLDYDHWSLRASAAFKTAGAGTISGYYMRRYRIYDDREGRDQLGNRVPGSDLEYDYDIVQLTWDYALASNQDLQAYAYLENRNDNGSGYYDTTWKRVRVRYRVALSELARLEAAVTYRDYAYDINDVLSTIEGEDPVNAKEGFSYEIVYSFRLRSDKQSTWWMELGASYEDYDNASAVYVYERGVVQAGLHVAY